MSCADSGQHGAESVSGSRPLVYPPAAWRLTPQALADVVLTTSHILIRYKGAEPEFSSLRAPNWRVEAPPERSRSDALKLARDIAERARANPERFASLAQSHSDDLTTRDFGGSLGTWSAELMFPEFLDAISTMEVGGVSDLIETPMGFHVLALRRTPAEQLVSADEIVVGYAGASLLDPLDGGAIARSRDEALALATEISRKATAAPADFGNLVRAHSEHESARKAGDIGTWSTHEAYIYHREIEAISALEIGAISDPIDSALGFRIFRRKPAGPRAQPARKYQTEIPRPTSIDVEYMVRNAVSPEMAAGYVAHLGRTIDESNIDLEPAQAELVRNLFNQLEIDMRSADANARMRGLSDFRAELKRTLGEQKFASLQARIHLQIRAQETPELANGLVP